MPRKPSRRFHKIEEILPSAKKKVRGGRRIRPDQFECFYRNKEPRTRFEALMFELKLTIRELSYLCDYSEANMGNIMSGKHLATIPIAKRIQEEARKRGILITLDELYQSVAPW